MLQILTSPERMLEAQQLREQIQPLEQALVELRKEYRRYRSWGQVDWKDTNNRVAALNQLIKKNGLLRWDIAAYVGITKEHHSVVLSVKRARLTRQLQQDIRNAVVAPRNSNVSANRWVNMK